jgi:hypothetical protein
MSMEKGLTVLSAPRMRMISRFERELTSGIADFNRMIFSAGKMPGSWCGTPYVVPRNLGTSNGRHMRAISRRSVAHSSQPYARNPAGGNWRFAKTRRRDSSPQKGRDNASMFTYCSYLE